MKQLLTAVAATVCFGAGSMTFTSHDLTITAPDGLTMGATITMPDSATPRGAVVLATGSGIQNRDEEVLGVKPFKRLAEYLSTHGYAVLRVDDRGLDDPTAAATAGMPVIYDDIRAAVGVMDSLCHGVPLGVIGHSAGGNNAIRLGADDPRIDFIVTMAAPAWRGDSVIMSQARAISVAMTGSWAAEAMERRLLDIARSPLPRASASLMMLSLMTQEIGDMANIPGVTEQLSGQIDRMLGPWYRDMLRYDPADDITRVKVPYLAINGDRDMQVLPDNLKTIKDLNPSSDTLTVRGHNHLFEQCATGLPDEYGKGDGAPSDIVLTIITEWLDNTTARR